jgi:hypothetical protein
MLCTDDLDAPTTSAPRIQSVEKPRISVPVIPIEPTVTDAAPKAEGAAAKPSIVEAEDLTLDGMVRHWERLLKEVSPPSVRMSLKDATISGVESGTVLLSFASSFHRDKIADTKASRTVEDILQSIFMKPVRIRCSVEKAATRITTEPTTDLAEAAAEVFGGM